MKRKPIKGETLLIRNVGNNAWRQASVVSRVKVERVGRKYFAVRHNKMLIEFHIDDWRHVTPGTANRRGRDAYVGRHMGQGSGDAAQHVR